MSRRLAAAGSRPRGAIVRPAGSVDFEVELVAVIGRLVTADGIGEMRHYFVAPLINP